jgi:hypothetical protein
MGLKPPVYFDLQIRQLKLTAMDIRLSIHRISLFPLLNFCRFAYQVINIVISIDQAAFFIRADLKIFAALQGVYGNRLVFQINGYGCFGIFFNGFKYLARKPSDTCTGSNPLFRALLLKISAKKLETTTLKP